MSKKRPANRTRTGSKKPGTFQPGQSGNPGGRPKEAEDIKALARTHTTSAVDRLAFWMASDNPKASVSAAVALLDRAWGRPAQSVTGADGGPVQTITNVIHKYIQEHPSAS